MVPGSLAPPLGGAEPLHASHGGPWGHIFSPHCQWVPALLPTAQTPHTGQESLGREIRHMRIFPSSSAGFTSGVSFHRKLEVLAEQATPLPLSLHGF